VNRKKSIFLGRRRTKGEESCQLDSKKGWALIRNVSCTEVGIVGKMKEKQVSVSVNAENINLLQGGSRKRYIALLKQTNTVLPGSSEKRRRNGFTGGSIGLKGILGLDETNDLWTMLGKGQSSVLVTKGGEQ